MWMVAVVIAMGIVGTFLVFMAGMGLASAENKKDKEWLGDLILGLILLVGAYLIVF